ncbi:kinesin-like protein KIF12 isoform X1 [Anopheles albimanus]|uniref:kinesin-like protein KIF12 isoform X1 n=2 Tax=Anopheles albimanus TaxID=7167 RepID=UPI00163EA445|nr:kinesin-like protein KIF12 isoform X1 [Anopheles albimanus]XP_035789984.1 kinesin-like protein KIF12 isoform X1 [Anopheles albimanus]
MVYKPPGTSISSRGLSSSHGSTSSLLHRIGHGEVAQSLSNLSSYRADTRGPRAPATGTGSGDQRGSRKQSNNMNESMVSGAGGVMKRSNSLNNKYNNGQARRSNSTERMNNGAIVYNRGRSPLRNSTTNLSGTTNGSIGRNQRVLIRSRGNDIGSLDNLDNMTQASTGSSSSVPGTPEDNINVVVRVRPLNGKEARNGDDMVVQFPGNGQILCDGMPQTSGGQKHKLFSYNVVFEPGATQDDVLQYSGVKRLIEMAIEGFSCTAFCYGQTGSGKTHTLTGPPELFYRKPDPAHEDHGLVFRSFLYLFKLLQERKDTNFVLKASFLEIYNEKVIDLLNPGSARKPLAVRWSKKSRGFFVENLFMVDCEELDDLLAVLEEGMRNRHVGSHLMNDYSSRSHTILTVNITSEQQAEGGVFISKQGKINFVDLAGSEMTKKTHSEGKTLEEANNINKSLMVLGYCIASLSDPKKRGGHIPYRDSKLTKLLADSLAGNGVTLMIACISPALSNVTETINTLRYAARAKRIRTKPVIVMDPREALILSLKREIGALQNENEHLRTALNLQTEAQDINSQVDMLERRQISRTPPKIDLDRVADMESNELKELLKVYVTENQALRQENSELFSTREMIIRDQELVCRENERLLKKLEDVNSVCCRSPIIPARPTFSAEMLNFSTTSVDAEVSNIWRNPLSSSADSMGRYQNESLDGRVSANENKIPDLLQKELDKRRIGDSINTIANNLKRNNSWDTANRANGSGQTVKLASRKGSADSRHSDPSQTRSSHTRIIDLSQNRYPSVSSSGGVARSPWNQSTARAASAQKRSPAMFLRKQNGRLTKSKSTDEGILPLKRNIFGSLISLDGDDDASLL